MRQRMDGELEQLRSNMHRILSEQQQEFAQAFGLSDEQSSSEVNHCKKNQHCFFCRCTFAKQRDQAIALLSKLRQEKFENVIITGLFGFRFEENLNRNIT